MDLAHYRTLSHPTESASHYEVLSTLLSHFATLSKQKMRKSEKKEELKLPNSLALATKYQSWLKWGE